MKVIHSITNMVLRKVLISVRRSYVEWDGSNCHIILRKFVCSHEGVREEKHMKRKMEDRKRRPQSITRVGCKAKLVIVR